MESLNKEELLCLLEEYDKYIHVTCDDEQNIINKFPVCIKEFYYNEFKNI